MSVRKLQSLTRGTGRGGSMIRGFVEDQWVCQMEGLLIKRGAGYKGDQDKAKKKDKKEGGALGAFKWLLNKRKGSGLIKKGSAEKRRYFELVTMAADADNPPKAELRYYAKTKPDGTPKGIVNLSTDMRVELLNHSTVCLITANRTYFLRPVGNAEQESSSSSRVTAGKWIHSLEFAIAGIKAHDAACTPQARQLANPVMRMSVNFSAEDIAKERQRLLSVAAQAAGQESSNSESKDDNIVPPNAPNADEDAAHDAATKVMNPAEDRKMLQRNLAEFEELWSKFGIHAYNALLAHFGPVQIELQRLEEHIKVRCNMVDVEIKLFKERDYKSTQVAANEQKSSAIVLQGLYQSVVKRTEKVQSHHKTLIQEVLTPLQELVKTVDAELDRIVNYNSGTIKTIERLQKGYTEIQESIIEIQTQIKMNEATLAEYDQMTDAQLAKLASKKGAKGGASGGSFTSSKASVVTTDDIELLENDLRTSQGMLADCKSNMRLEEKKHTTQMKLALQALQSLEIKRLQTQTEIVKRLQEIEGKVFVTAETFFGDDSLLIQTINDIDPVADLQATSEKLLRDANLYK